MNFYKHGGNLREEAILNNIKENEIIDFSSNINPLRISLKLKNTLIKNIDEITKYPDNECNDLKIKLSNYLKIDRNKLIIGNGAIEIIHSFFSLYKEKKALLIVPTFSEYEIAAKRNNIDIEYFHLNEGNDFYVDLEIIFKYVQNKNIDLVILCNPNNPTSKIIDINNLKNFIGKLSELKVDIMVDESFIELSENSKSIIELNSEYNNLFIIRSFTKFYSMPGLRLGYGIGNKDIISKIFNNKISWSVNILSLLAGEACLEDYDFIDKTKIWLKNEKSYLFNKLNKISWIKVFYPYANFILIKILKEDLNSKKLKDILIKNKILIRDCSNFVGLDNKFVRIAIKNRESNEKLVRILYKI
jgi:threonine-phosphate decarboxylase